MSREGQIIEPIPLEAMIELVVDEESRKHFEEALIEREYNEIEKFKLREKLESEN